MGKVGVIIKMSLSDMASTLSINTYKQHSVLRLNEVEDFALEYRIFFKT